MIAKIKIEMKEVGLITLYFFACFALFIIIKKLMLYQYNINFWGWTTALVGALAMGKVVFFIDKTPLHKYLKHFKPIYEILTKALVYTIIVYIVSILEKTIHYWIDDPLLGTWNSHLFSRGKGALLLAHAIYIYFCFVGFYFLHFLDEKFGRDKIIKLLTTSR